MIRIKAVMELFSKGTDKAKKEVTGINRELDQAADNAERMNRTLGKTKTPGDTKQYRTQRSIAGTRGAEGRNFSGLASMAEGGVQGSFVGAYASLAANIFAVTAAFQALSNAARTEQLTKGLELMGARGGVALTLTAKNLQSVTDNAISAADAMKATAQASAAGFSGDEIARLGQVARGASLALGRDMGDALDRLTKGAVKLEPELLDELGIMTRLDDAVKVYADANGKAVSALTQTERRQAFLNAVLEEGERKFGDINEQIEANPYDKLSAAVRQTSTDLGILANTVLKPIASFFAENPFALVIPGVFLLSKALQGLGITAAGASLNVEKAFDTAYRGGEGLKSTSKAVQTIFEDVATQPGEIKNLRDLSLAFRKAEVALIAKNGALKTGDKIALAYNKTMLFTNFAVRNAALAVRGLGVAIATAAVPMLAITAIVAGLTWAFAEAVKAWDKFTGQTKEIKESKARMKELAEQANDTAAQIRLMMQPGKEQQGLAFDAITNSAKAAQAELETFIAIQERSIEIEEKGLKVRAGFRAYEATPQAGAKLIGDFATFDEAKTAGGDSISEILLSEEQAYTKIRDKAMEALNIDKERADLIISQYKIRSASLPPEKAMTALSSMLTMNTADFGKYLLDSLKSSASIAANFKDMEESGKKITDATKDLFPKKTITAATKIADGFKEILTNIAAGPAEGEDADMFNMGLAAKAADLGPTIRDNVTALKAQGIELGQHQGTLDNIKALEDARIALAKAKLGTDEKVTAQAQTQVDEAQKKLAEDQKGIVALLTTFEVEQRILGVISQINAEKLKTYALESQIARQAGDNAKSALEYEQTIKDTKRLEAGLDLNIPEELTIDYRLRIAEIEKNTASEIARIKKDTLRLEAEQRSIEIQSEIARLEKTLEDSGKQRLSGLSDESLQALIKNPNADRDQALTEIQIRLQEELLTLQDKALSYSLAGADAESLRADGAFKRLEAEKKGLNPIKLAAKYALEELDTLKEKQNILNANADALSMGAQLSNQVTSLLKATELPALQQKLTIAEETVKEQKAFNDNEKEFNALSLEDQNFNIRKLGLLETQRDTIQEQINGVNQIVDSATAGNIAEAASLDIQDKKLGILREQAGAMKALEDAQLDLKRAQAEAGATAQGRELSASEQGALKAAELKSEIESITGISVEDGSRIENSQIDLLEKEKNLLIKRSELEEKLFTIRLAAAERELQNAIDLAPAGSDTSKARKALDTLQSLSLDFPSVFAEERAAILSNKELEEQTLQARADGLKAELSVTPTTPEQVGNQILLGLSNELRGAFSGFGLTGQGADFYASERQGILSNTGLSPEEKKEELKLLKAQSFEIQQQQILAEGLQDIFAGLGDSISNAFVSMIDGSKTAKQAFGEMAQQILRDLAQMIIKMLAFKAIEAGLNLFGGGIGTKFMNFINPGAAGGVIPLATGGVMDRAMGVQGVIKQPTYLVGEGRYNEAVVPLPNGRSIPVQMHGGSSQNNNVAVTVNMTNNGSQTETQGPDPSKMGQAIAAAVQRELIAQKAPGGLLNRYSTV